MTRMSAELRRQPTWWARFRDENTLALWRAQALAQAKHMDESHVDYVFQELDGYANLRDEESGVEVRLQSICLDTALNLFDLGVLL